MIESPHAVFGVFAGVVLEEAEAAGSLLDFIQAHDDTLDISRFTEQLV